MSGPEDLDPYWDAWYLSITSWRGITPGAEHYYGSLHGPHGPSINVRDDHAETIRFVSRENLIALAIRTWEALDPEGPLYLGAPIVDDREMLAPGRDPVPADPSTPN